VHRCSSIVGAASVDSFGYQMYDECKARIESPIEQYLFVAISTLSHVCYMRSISITPQYQVNRFRVDFFVAFTKASGEVVSVIVECDSQQFHERTESQRRYEKARDRALLVAGYQTFHFTGKEIKDEPFSVAAEVLSHITGIETKELIVTIASFEEISVAESNH
jgi:very-short-patch-repair endonuclease